MKLVLKRLLAASVLAVALFSTTATADGIDAPKVSNMTPKEFLAYHADVAKKLDSRSYEHVDNEQRRDVASAQAEIKSVLDGKRSMDELTDAQRIELFNAHEHVVSILNDAELDRRICKRVKKIGSNRGELVCTTKRAMQARNADKTQFRRTRACTPGSYGCFGQ
ncbi:MAG TPA: hypothetical protein VFO79_15505 [Xanthomonadales bacterium]|nr:hypothetical protein [Xanthomonadales bacterium]